MKITINLDECPCSGVSPNYVYRSLYMEYWSKLQKIYQNHLWGMATVCDSTARELYAQKTGRSKNVKIEELKSLHIDVEKNIYEVNGRDISQNGKYFNLVFEDGTWTLVVSEDTGYSTNAHSITIDSKMTAKVIQQAIRGNDATIQEK